MSFRHALVHGAIFVGGVIFSINLVIFAVLFPGVQQTSFINPVHSASLPLSRDRFRPPQPPVFLSELSADNIYISLERPESFILLKYNADEAVSLASLTKLMTALVALDNEPVWDKKVVISPLDYRGGAKPRIYAGETLTMNDLWFLMLIASDNDSTVAFVRGLGLSENDFVKAMNDKAKFLGLDKTNFVEPTGLSALNKSTAREFAVLVREAFSRREIREILRFSDAFIRVKGQERRIYSSDQILKQHKDATIDGWSFLTGKTGYIGESGYNAALLAKDENEQIILVVILGADTPELRAKEVNRIVTWAFETKY